MSSYLDRLRDLKLGKIQSTDAPKGANSGDPAKKDQTPAKGLGARKSPKIAPMGKPAGKPGKTRSKIKNVSKKRAGELREYAKLRKEYLATHERCEIPVEGCTVKSVEVHHSEGREGKRLLDVSKFKAACSNCHRVATVKSLQAIAAGHSGSRLG